MSRSLEFRLSEPARDDLFELARFVAREHPAAARRVVEEIERAIRGLAESPGKGHRRDDLSDEPGVLFWPVRRYLIVYRRDTRPLEIVRIVHGGRDVRRELEE